MYSWNQNGSASCVHSGKADRRQSDRHSIIVAEQLYRRIDVGNVPHNALSQRE
jgi:hypothetical protein